MRLIDTNPLLNSDDFIGPRMYIIRRVSGHLRRDGSAWTFLFFCDPVATFEESHYVSDIPGQSMPYPTDWITGSLNDDTPADHYDRLIKDGFGLVVKVLREIKSSWKLLLSEFETFLEDIVSYGIHLLTYKRICCIDTRIERQFQRRRLHQSGRLSWPAVSSEPRLFSETIVIPTTIHQLFDEHACPQGEFDHSS